MGGLIERKANDALASSRAGQGMAWHGRIRSMRAASPYQETTQQHTFYTVDCVEAEN